MYNVSPRGEVCGEPVKKFENQLRFGLDPIIGEPGGLWGAIFSVANRILLNLSDIFIGFEEGPESRGLNGGLLA